MHVIFIGFRPQKYGGFAMRNVKTRTVIRSLTALVMALCLFTSMLPAALAAASAGDDPGYLKKSATKVYVKLTKETSFFTGVTSGTGTVVKVPAGSVCQLYSEDWYVPADKQEYYSVFYNSQRYNVLCADVKDAVMTAAELESYITGTIWKQTTFDTLRPTAELRGDIRVHALQLALKRLGYLKGDVDGSYGDQTTRAVKNFQKANKLDNDGHAGQATLSKLYALALGTSAPSIGSSSTSTTVGAIKTRVSVNLRKRASTDSARLAVIPASITLNYTATTSVSGITWYTVVYNGDEGWVMGSYVNPTTLTSGSSAPALGTVRTTAKVNLRKRASISTARLAEVPRGVNLSYTATTVASGVTWYKVTYDGETGWIMGTYASVTGSSSSSSGATVTTPAIGTVTITQPGTRVRKTADGAKTGTVLAKGTVVSLLAQPTQAGGYTWYNIRTGSGLVGFVRGDCAEITSTTGSGGSTNTGGTISTTSERVFIRMPADTYVFTTETKPETGNTLIKKDTIVMLASNTTYTKNGVEYCSLNYQNEKFNAVYAELKAGIMTTADVDTYINSLLKSDLPYTLERAADQVGDVYVYAMQAALDSLGYYTGKLDGNFGSGSQSAVRNFQRNNKLEVDGKCGKETWKAIYAGLSGTNAGGGTTGSVTVTDFGVVSKVVKASWDYDDNGGKLFPKHTYATVMDIETKKVFRIYRWSGGNHADCVPATVNDTKIMCSIVGFNFDGSHPTAAQLNLIKADEKNNNATYTWPDYNNSWGKGKDIGSAWDRRAALLNVNGTVYPVSIYGYPHGYDGTSAFCSATFDGKTKFAERNSFYGMMCLHFTGSKTHGGAAVDSGHQAAIDKAYNYAKQQWPSLVK